MAADLLMTSLTISFLVVMLTGGINADASGQISLPAGCTSNACTYQFSWSYTTASDSVTITITSQQPSGTWVAGGIGPTPYMETMDVYFGYIGTDGVGHVYDAYVGQRYSLPQIDGIQNIYGQSITYNNGVYTMTLSRPRTTNDTTNDVQLSDTNNYYIKCPVNGGPMNGDSPGKHYNTPTVPSNQVCFCSGASGGSTTVASITGSTVSGSTASPGGSSTSGNSTPTSLSTSASTVSTSKKPNSASSVSLNFTLLTFMLSLALFRCF